MNRVIENGTELHNVTVVIVDGVATVTPNHEPPITTQDGGGGPGEEHGPK
jgi:hypothetical protein